MSLKCRLIGLPHVALAWPAAKLRHFSSHFYVALWRLPLVAIRGNASVDRLLSPSVLQPSLFVISLAVWIFQCISCWLLPFLLASLSFLLDILAGSVFSGYPPPKIKTWLRLMSSLNTEHRQCCGCMWGHGAEAVHTEAAALALVSLHNTDYNPEIQPTNVQQFSLAWALKSHWPSVPLLASLQRLFQDTDASEWDCTKLPVRQRWAMNRAHCVFWPNLLPYN